MIAIRGATTVLNDEKTEIISATAEMLDLIMSKNKLNKEDLLFILFSTTDDIKSFYPAAAAREAGYTACALYSSSEPDISGALKKCIRIMVVADRDKPKEEVKHVYLNGARNLRRDLSDD